MSKVGPNTGHFHSLGFEPFCLLFEIIRFLFPSTHYKLVITSFIFFQKLPGKECDDEEECGSAADVFNIDDSGDVITREFNKVILQRNKASAE